MDGRGMLSGAISLVVNTLGLGMECMGFESRGGNYLLRALGMLFA